MFVLGACTGGSWRANYKYLMTEMYDYIDPSLFKQYSKPSVLCQEDFRRYMNEHQTYCFKKIVYSYDLMMIASSTFLAIYGTIHGEVSIHTPQNPTSFVH